MAKLVSPYIDTEMYTRIKLSPYQMNNDIYLNLKNNLKKKVEKKCIKYGYITKVYKINEYTHGIIVPENLDSCGKYKIKYSCRFCYPVVGTQIICRIDLINKVLVKANNGPIICIIKISNINKELFSLNNNGDIIYNNDNKILKNGDYIKVNILAKNFCANDDRIVILARLIDLSTDEENKEFYEENLESEKIFESDDQVINTDDNENTDNDSLNNVENNNYIDL